LSQDAKNDLEEIKMYNLKNAEQINYELSSLPKAVEKNIFVSGKTLPEKKYKAIEVDGEVVSIPSDHYNLVQHETAFRPIIEGLTMRGVHDFKFSLFANHKRAWLNVLVGNGYDGVSFGFRAMNSFDRSTAISFGLNSFVKNKTIEIVGYRQVCSNGMIVRVPLENAEFVREEEVVKIKSLLNKTMRIRHTSSADKLLEELQFTVEAFLLMKNPLQRIIEKAEMTKLDREQAEKLVEKYVGRRRLDKIMNQYGMEEQTLWGLYNSITYLASHTNTLNKATKFNSMLEKASNLLEQEITVPTF
jgi:hypothetical protein